VTNVAHCPVMTAHVADDPAAIAPLLLNIVDVARLLAIGRSSVYELIASGRLRPVRLGRSVRIPVAQVHELIQRSSDRAASA